MGEDGFPGAVAAAATAVAVAAAVIAALLALGVVSFPQQTENYATVDLIITDQEGNKYVFTAPSGWEPLSVMVEDDYGRAIAIQSIEAVPRFSVTYTGTASAVRVDGEIRWEAFPYAASTSIPLKADPLAKQLDPSQAASGAAVPLPSHQLLAGEIDVKIAEPGTYWLRVTVDLTVTVTFADGSVDSRSGSAVAEVYVSVEKPGIEGLTVTVETTSLV